jgi:hypothetical protein
LLLRRQYSDGLNIKIEDFKAFNLYKIRVGYKKIQIEIIKIRDLKYKKINSGCGPKRVMKKEISNSGCGPKNKIKLEISNSHEKRGRL